MEGGERNGNLELSVHRLKHTTNQIYALEYTNWTSNNCLLIRSHELASHEHMNWSECIFVFFFEWREEFVHEVTHKWERYSVPTNVSYFFSAKQKEHTI